MSIELVVLTLLVFIASAMGTFSGFGTSTIMVPVMLLFFPLSVTLLFVGIIHWFGDICEARGRSYCFMHLMLSKATFASYF